MKSLIVGITLLLLSNILIAQTEQGRIMAGGNASLSLQLIEDNENTFSISLNPSIGRFFSDNFAGGTTIGISYFTANNFSSGSLSFTPFLRKYFGENKHAKLFLDGGFGVIFSKNENNVFGNSTEANFSFRGGPGLSLFLSKNVAVDLQINCSYFTRKESAFNEPTPIKRVGFYLGFQVFLDGKKEEKE